MISRPAARLATAALLLALSGCVFILPSGTKGDVVFTWTFGDAVTRCALVPGVASILVEIPGQTLENGGVYGCTDASQVDGVRLRDFFAGDYEFTITARDSLGQPLYRRSGTFIVDGPVTVPVELLAVAGAQGGAYLTWSFPATGASGGQPATCAQLPGPVTAVQVSIDSGNPQEFSCAAGQTSPGVRVDGLLGGSHTIDLSARDASGFFYFRKTVTFTVAPGAWGAQHFGLDWLAGSLAVKWGFSSGGTSQTCAQAGVTKVLVNLRVAGTATWLYGTAGFEQVCLNGGVQGTLFPYLYGGTYEVFFQAQGASGLYTSPQAPQALPTVTVTAGVFPVLDVNAHLIPLTLP
jgi:hypothetical protein